MFQLWTQAGDCELEVVRYKRLSPLYPEKDSLAGIHALRPGDCVVAFSRRQLYKFKATIERGTEGSLQCAVVYGGLPPAARREQARNFNEPNGAAQVFIVTIPESCMCH